MKYLFLILLSACNALAPQQSIATNTEEAVEAMKDLLIYQKQQALALTQIARYMTNNCVCPAEKK